MKKRWLDVATPLPNISLIASPSELPNTMGDYAKNRWQDVATLLLSLWLIVSPFMLPSTMGDYVLFNNSLIVGVLVMLVALAVIFRPDAWKEWVLVALASWLIASAYLLGNGVLVHEEFMNGSLSALAKNQFIIGLLVMVGATVGLYRQQAIREMDA